MDIILVKNEEEADYLSKEYGIMKVVYDIGGSLTKLQISLEAGAEQQQRYDERSGLSKKECELG
jgi:hypothetical protein